MKNIKTQLVAISSGLIGILSHHYISKLLDYSSELEAAKQQAHIVEKQDSEMSKVYPEFSDIKTQISNISPSKTKKESSKYFKAKVGKSETEKDEVLNLYDNNDTIGTVNEEFYRCSSKASVQCKQTVLEFQRELDETINTNSLLPDFSPFIKYIDNLNVLELSALLHITIIFIILILTSNLLSIYFTSEVINFFNLDKRFPKLSFYFKYRIKFQRYYILINIFLICFFCLFSIFMDLLVFIL